MQDIDLCDFSNVVMFTGAGISAESGIPTYRNDSGLWEKFDPMECACQQAFDKDPKKVWAFHNYCREFVTDCEPNLGHKIIAATEKYKPNTVVITQNVDGLHQRAGSQNVYELHGSLWKVRCDSCGWRGEDNSSVVEDLECPECGAPKRPDLVWFGDMLNMNLLNQVEEVLSQCDLLVSIGTSALVYPAAQLPLMAKTNKALLVEVNPEDTELSEHFDVKMRMKGSEALALLGRNVHIKE